MRNRSCNLFVCLWKILQRRNVTCITHQLLKWSLVINLSQLCHCQLCLNSSEGIILVRNGLKCYLFKKNFGCIVNINAGKPSNNYDWPGAVQIYPLKKQKNPNKPVKSKTCTVNNEQLYDKLKVIFKQQIIRFFSLNHWGDFFEGSCLKAKQGVNGILELCFFTTCDKVWKKKSRGWRLSAS